MSVVEGQDKLAGLKQVIQTEINKQTELQTAALPTRLSAV
jgi:hypothetical protein